MFQNLSLFQTAQAMAQHAGARQALAAQNMANANTPGYRAMDLAPFAASYAGTAGPRGAPLIATRAGHLGAGGSASGTAAQHTAVPMGTEVSVEHELMRTVEIQRQHSRALAVYKSGLSILRTSIGGR